MNRSNEIPFVTAIGRDVVQEHVQEGFNVLPIVLPLVGVLIGGGITFGYLSFFRWRDRERTKRERLLRFHRTTQLAMIDSV